MTIRTFNDFKNLKKGAWLEDGSGMYEVVAPYNEFNKCIGLAEVIMAPDDSGEYALRTENPNVTFSDVRGIEIIACGSSTT